MEQGVLIIVAFILLGCALAVDRWGLPRRWPWLLTAVLLGGGLLSSYYGHKPHELPLADIAITIVAAAICLVACLIVQSFQNGLRSWREWREARRRRRRERFEARQRRKRQYKL